MILAYLEESMKSIGLYDAQKERTILKVKGVWALLYRMVIDSETSEEKECLFFNNNVRVEVDFKSICARMDEKKPQRDESE